MSSTSYFVAWLSWGIAIGWSIRSLCAHIFDNRLGTRITDVENHLSSTSTELATLCQNLRELQIVLQNKGLQIFSDKDTLDAR